MAGAVSTPKRILLVAGQSAAASAVEKSLSEAGHAVQREPVLQGGPGLKARSIDLAVLHLEPDAGTTEASEVLGGVREALGSGSPPLLVLATCRDGRSQHRFLLNEDVVNFLGVDPGRSVEPRVLCATVAKMTDEKAFGLEPFLEPGAETSSISIRGSRDKRDAIAAVEALSQQIGCHAQVVHGIAVVADEIISNALYNAPVDESGLARFANQQRWIPVLLGPGEEIVFSMATDGKRLGLGVRDPFGSMSRATVLSHLRRCAALEGFRVDTKLGGAGLGLYYVLHLVEHMLLKVSPGKSTEVLGLVSVTHSYRDFVLRPRSLNLIIPEGTRA